MLNTPPFLIAAALAFWGWRTGWWWLALPLAAIFEASRFVKARWEFPDDSRLWNGWGGIVTILEDGDLLLGGFFGIKRVNVGDGK